MVDLMLHDCGQKSIELHLSWLPLTVEIRHARGSRSLDLGCHLGN